MSYVFYTVQIEKRESCEYKTYMTTVEDIKTFEEVDKKKAISLWKKRKANTIWRHEVEYLDKAPYYIDEWCEGHKEFIDLEDDDFKLVLAFRDGNKIFEMIDI